MRSDFLDLFDEYYSGTLDEQQRQAFEDRLETDVEIKEAFHEYRDLRNGIDYSIMKTLKEELQELETGLPEVQLDSAKQQVVSMKSPKFSGQVLLKVAAVVILVAVSAAVLFQLEQSGTPQDLFNQHFEPYPNEFVSAKRGNAIGVDPLVQAFQAYDNQDYQAAIIGFNDILAEQENIMVLFYLGCAQLAQNQSHDAIATFERFLEISQDSVSNAQWYLALGYLQQNRIEEARTLLEQLIDDPKYSKDARKILRKME